jgi:hypothetical protein
MVPVTLVEPVSVPEYFCTGISEPEDCGDFVRCVYYVQRGVQACGAPVAEVVFRVVYPKAAWDQIMHQYWPHTAAVVAAKSQPNKTLRS